MALTYRQYKEAADFILRASPLRPRTAVVLGSGLGGFSARVEDAQSLPYDGIPGFPVSTAPGHAGRLLLGRVAGREVAVLAGRFHHYEGWSYGQAAFYVGVLRLMGVENLILSNAAGGIRSDLRPGDLMLVSDHINLAGVSPCAGPNVDELGPRFFDMTDAYSAQLRQAALRCAGELGLSVTQGVYAFMAGPQFETPAEIRALRTLGADAVGMSTVPEVIAAAHCGMKTLCISCITNYAAGLGKAPLASEEINLQADKNAEIFGNYIKSIIKALK